jgi:hypothetical protein
MNSGSKYCGVCSTCGRFGFVLRDRKTMRSHKTEVGNVCGRGRSLAVRPTVQRADLLLRLIVKKLNSRWCIVHKKKGS